MIAITEMIHQLKQELLNSLRHFLESPRILIVEDDCDVAEMTAEVLQKHFPHIHIACNGAEGLRAVKEFNPDVIVADVRMPVLTGDQMLVELRNSGFEKPVIFLTGYTDEETVLKSFQCDAYEFLAKPVSEELLIEIVRKALRAEHCRLAAKAERAVLLRKLSSFAGKSQDPEFPVQYLLEVRREVEAELSKLRSV